MKYILILFISLIFLSCSHLDNADKSELVRIQLIDREGTCETISSTQRLEKYKHTDFLSSQSFQKVVRIFKNERTEEGKTILTSYHPNGQIRQYLEGKDLRAHGKYHEWHSNGILKIDANIVGGHADLDLTSQGTWLFDEVTRAYDDEGNLIAEISYVKGVLDGHSIYYHPNSKVQKKIPYKNGKIEGSVFEFYTDATLRKKACYHKDKLHGTTLTYWENEEPLAIEEYVDDKLVLGQYFDCHGSSISEVQNGVGTKFVILNESAYQLIEYKHGKPEGQIQTFNENNQLTNSYSIKNEKKHGRESQFYDNQYTSFENTLKYTIDWIEDQIHGNVKTWYENGYMESQRQYCKNKKNGPSICWYNDGSLMMVEEYENDLLINGKYYKKGQTDPTSTINKGSGIATIYDREGVFIQKIEYQHSKPQL